jgi:uncharacterized membrane protein YgcG
MYLRKSLGWLVAIAVLAAPLPSQADIPTLFRKKTVPSAKKPPTMNGLARLVTHLEDDLKKYGSITVKAPDVWGESTLMSLVQEYERYMREDAADFKATMQGYVARADQAAAQAEFSMGLAAANEEGSSTAVEPPAEKFINPPGTPFNLVPSSGVTLSLEPTEETREHSVFLKVNQALRRTNLGDDNSRQPGYTSYVLRFPVSVIPGRQTYQGCAAVVNLRARLVLGESHLHDTFPRLAISDFAAVITPWLSANWGVRDVSPEKPRASPESKSSAEVSPGRRAVNQASQPLDERTIRALYGDTVYVLRQIVEDHFTNQPKADQLEEYVFYLLMQTQANLERQNQFATFRPNIEAVGRAVVNGCLHEVETIRNTTLTELQKTLQCPADGAFEGANCNTSCQAKELASLAWILFAQSGVLNEDIKRLVASQQGTAGASPEACAVDLCFFEPNGEGYIEAAAVWNQLIEETFPVHLFTLDPIVEQQNYTDAFSRRRELQLAMAMAVAKGEMRARAAVRFTRQLSLDMLTIGLNRTAVAYAADNDTFGWYFYPRLQSPPEESSNIAAFARLLWSAGPTRRFDLRHRQLEPGIRECEAVIVMPAFVPNLKIDITTNWERLNKPGAIKVDYVKMIDEAAMIQKAIGYSSGVGDQECYRPEDYDILCSRIDQLEKMLPMQQQLVRLPFPYVLRGSELFDNGNRHLPPQLVEYYGLEWLPAAKPAEKAADKPKAAGGAGGVAGLVGGGAGGAGSEGGGGGGGGGGFLGGAGAGGGGGGSVINVTTTVTSGASGGGGGGSAVYFFLSGRHFHPTQTHVIAGGVKSDSLDATSSTSSPASGASGTPAAGLVTVSGPAEGTAGPKVTTPTTPSGSSATPKVADVAVISRELLRVKLTDINPQLTNCCVSVYVATPAGVSNELVIPLQGTCPGVCRPNAGVCQNECTATGELESAKLGTNEKGKCESKVTFETGALANKLLAPDSKLDVSVCVKAAEWRSSLCVPLNGYAKVTKQADNTYLLTINNFSIWDGLLARGATQGSEITITIGYPETNGLKCLTGRLAVTGLPKPTVVLDGSDEHEMIATPSAEPCCPPMIGSSDEAPVTEENPLRTQQRTSDRPEENFRVPAPEALPEFDESAPPLPSEARRRAAPEVNAGAPRVRPAAAANPIPLDKAARLQPVRLPPIRDAAVRQAAAWE